MSINASITRAFFWSARRGYTCAARLPDRISPHTIFSEKRCGCTKKPKSFALPATTKRFFDGTPALAQSWRSALSRARSRTFVRCWNSALSGRSPRLSGFGEYFDHLFVECPNVVRLPAGDESPVSDDFFIDPIASGILNVGAKRRP